MLLKSRVFSRVARWTNSAIINSSFNVRDFATNSALPEGWENAKPFESIPGPRPFPVLGNTWRMLVGPYNIMQDLLQWHARLHSEFGNIVTFRKVSSVTGDFLMVYDEDLIEQVLRGDDVPTREGFYSITYYRHELRKDIFGDVGGLIAMQGEKWHSFRSLVNPILLQPRTTEQYVGVMNTVADEFIERVKDLAKRNSQMPDDFDNELNKWAFESIAVVALDRRLGLLSPKPNETSQKMVNYMVETFKLFRVLDLNPMGLLYRKLNIGPWKRFVFLQDFFTEIAIKYIKEAEDKIRNDPDYLKKSELDKSAFERILERDRKVAMVMTLDMLMAGIDTTGKTLAAVLYYLAKYPETQIKLRKELIQILPQKDMPITKDMFSEAKYLRATIKEAMRLAPVAPALLRTTNHKMVLNGYQIPERVSVIMPTLYLTKSHYPQANEFIPERWLRTTQGDLSHKNISPFVSLPFGFGPRSCIGQRIAMLELETVVAKIIRNFVLNWNHADAKFGQEFLYGILEPLKLDVKLYE